MPARETEVLSRAARHRQVVDHLDGIAQDLEPLEVEPHGAQGAIGRIQQVPALDVRAWLPFRISVFCNPPFRSSTATWGGAVVSVGMMVNSTPRPPGSSEGSKWFRSPFAWSGPVNRAGVPRFADTRRMPLAIVANTMLPSSSQAAPRGPPPWIWQIVTADPPVIATFWSPASPKNPIHWLSGEMNGCCGSAILASGRASRRSIARTIRLSWASACWVGAGGPDAGTVDHVPAIG